MCPYFPWHLKSIHLTPPFPLPICIFTPVFPPDPSPLLYLITPPSTHFLQTPLSFLPLSLPFPFIPLLAPWSYSSSSSPCVAAASPLVSGPPPPPGAAGTCGSSPPQRPRTCWGQRSWRSGGRRWSRAASTGCCWSPAEGEEERESWEKNVKRKVRWRRDRIKNYLEMLGEGKWGRREGRLSGRKIVMQRKRLFRKWSGLVIIVTNVISSEWEGTASRCLPINQLHSRCGPIIPELPLVRKGWQGNRGEREETGDNVKKGPEMIGCGGRYAGSHYKTKNQVQVPQNRRWESDFQFGGALSVGSTGWSANGISHSKPCWTAERFNPPRQEKLNHPEWCPPSNRFPNRFSDKTNSKRESVHFVGISGG